MRRQALIDDFGFLNAAFGATWRAILAGALPRDVVPMESLAFSFDVHRAVGRSFRTDREPTVVQSSLAAFALERAVDEVDAMLYRVPLLEEVVGLDLPPSEVVESVRELIRLDGGFAEAAATRVDDAPVADRPHPVFKMPGADVTMVMRIHDLTWRTTTQIWGLIAQGRLSAAMMNTEQYEENVIVINHAVWRSISEAIAAGSDVTAPWATAEPTELLSGIDMIERRLALIPMAGQFGIEVPDDPEAVATMQELLAAAREVVTAVK